MSLSNVNQLKAQIIYLQSALEGTEQRCQTLENLNNVLVSKTYKQREELDEVLFYLKYSKSYNASFIHEAPF